MHGLFPPSSLRIYLQDFVRISDFPVLCQVIRPERPQMRFLYVGSGFCLGPPSAMTLTGTTLPLTSGSLLRARRGLSPPRIHKAFVDGIRRFQPCVLGTHKTGHWAGKGFQLLLDAPVMFMIPAMMSRIPKTMNTKSLPRKVAIPATRMTIPTMIPMVLPLPSGLVADP